METIQLADKLETISAMIEEIYDLTELLHGGLFNAPLDENWKREVFFERLHYYDSLLSTIKRAIKQKEHEILALSKQLYMIGQKNEKAVSA